MGLLLLAAGSALEPLLGLPVDLLRGVGAFLIPFAATLVWVSSRRAAGLVRAIVWGNVLWVVASIVLLVSGLVQPTVLGEVFVLVQAAAVAGFAYLEQRGLRRAQASLIPERA